MFTDHSQVSHVVILLHKTSTCGFAPRTNKTTNRRRLVECSMANYSFDTREKLSSIIINNQLLLVGANCCCYCSCLRYHVFVHFICYVWNIIDGPFFRFFLHPTEKKSPTAGKNVIQLGCEWIQIARIVLRAVA